MGSACCHDEEGDDDADVCVCEREWDCSSGLDCAQTDGIHACMHVKTNMHIYIYICMCVCVRVYAQVYVYGVVHNICTTSEGIDEEVIIIMERAA